MLETGRVIPYSALTREGAGPVWDEIRAGVTAKKYSN
jgi:hypothetical protein